jgi:hypothetical protein
MAPRGQAHGLQRSWDLPKTYVCAHPYVRRLAISSSATDTWGTSSAASARPGWISRQSPSVRGTVTSVRSELSGACALGRAASASWMCQRRPGQPDRAPPRPRESVPDDTPCARSTTSPSPRADLVRVSRATVPEHVRGRSCLCPAAPMPTPRSSEILRDMPARWAFKPFQESAGSCFVAPPPFAASSPEPRRSQ